MFTMSAGKPVVNRRQSACHGRQVRGGLCLQWPVLVDPTGRVVEALIESLGEPDDGSSHCHQGKCPQRRKFPVQVGE